MKELGKSRKAKASSEGGGEIHGAQAIPRGLVMALTMTQTLGQAKRSEMAHTNRTDRRQLFKVQSDLAFIG